MTAVESRPYATPNAHSVNAKVALAVPAVDLPELPAEWVPGSEITVSVIARIGPEFWVEAAILDSSEVRVAVVGTCNASRTSWRNELPLEFHVDGAATASGSLVMDGGSLAGEVHVNVWVIGPGQTIGAPGAKPTHPGAKLWEMPSPVVLKLEDTSIGFPTSAVSFAGTGRPAVPWSVECVTEASPKWTISSAVRLFVNTDLPLSENLLDGSADESLFQLIQADVHMVVMHQLSTWKDTFDAQESAAIAESDRESLAALGDVIAGAIGRPLGEAMRLIEEDLSRFTALSRASLQFGRSAK